MHAAIWMPNTYHGLGYPCQPEECAAVRCRQPMKQLFLTRMGDPENDQVLNERMSPLFHINKIRAPLIIAQGAKDPRQGLLLWMYMTQMWSPWSAILPLSMQSCVSVASPLMLVSSTCCI